MLISISIHMIMAAKTSWANRKAAAKRHSQKGSRERSWAARLMPVSGIMIFIFIIIHLANFKFYEKSTTMLDGHEVYDVYGMVLSRFQGDLWYVGVYLFFGRCGTASEPRFAECLADLWGICAADGK